MNTKALRQKILDLAIHGKLVPQDPNDEPASVLLERIKAEKERLIKEGKIKRTKRSKAACDKPHYPYELPKGWAWCKLEDIVSPNCTLGYGIVQPMENIPNGVPIVRPVDLVTPIIGLSGLKRISSTISDAYQRTILRGGEILFCVRGSVGKIAISSHELNGANVTRGISPIRFDSDVVTKYVFYHLQSFYSLSEIKRYSKGATLQQINVEDLKKISIAFPSIAEQKRIVESIEHWLSLVDSIEENKDNLQATIKQAKSKVLDLAFHGKLVPQDPTDEPASELLKRINPKAEIACDNPQYGKLPNGWCETLLGNIGTWQSGATPSRLRKDYYGGSIPWLKTGDLNDGIVQSIPECITERALEETSVKLNPAGSILIAMYGATIGRIGILSKPATTNQACCACVDYLPEKKFLFYFLLANRENFIAMGGGGAQPNISKEKIIHTHIPLPPQQEQHRIVAQIEKLFAQLDNIASSL